MPLINQGGQVTDIRNPYAAQQIGQGNFPAPMQPFPSGQFPGGYPGMQSYGGGAAYGYPIGSTLSQPVIYAQVAHGEPVILNPETGQAYPPGYVPEVNDPYTHESWQIGDSWAEAKELADAQLSESIRQSGENFFRPFEEKMGENYTNLTESAGRRLEEVTNQLGARLYQIANGGSMEGYQAPERGIDKATKAGQEMYKAGEQQFKMQQQMQQQQMIINQQRQQQQMVNQQRMLNQQQQQFMQPSGGGFSRPQVQQPFVRVR